MAVPTTAIRSAIKAVMQGTQGTTRVVATTKFGYGTFDGQPLAAQQSRAIQTSTKLHRFDIKIGAYEKQGASPLSITASYRNVRVPITIEILTTLKSTAQEAERDAQRDAVSSDADIAIQALCYPGNLTTGLIAAVATSTNIVSGRLASPDGTGAPMWAVISEDWKTHLLKSVIRASAIVQVTQAVA